MTLLGIALGLGAYTFAYAKGWSYLTNNPQACANCHVMNEHLKTARDFQRRGQFYLDFVESENSNGFHTPQEVTRILGDAIDFFRQGQVSLRPTLVAGAGAGKAP